MGNFLGCIEEVPDLQRLEYDMTPLKTHPVPIIWMVGPPGCGKELQGKDLSERVGYEVIDVRTLLKDESKKDTDRGKLLKDIQKLNKKIPDFIIVDLIKEAMLEKANLIKKGYVLVDFPRSSKQANLFVKEVGDVNFVLYLYANTEVLIKRCLEECPNEDPDKILRRIQLKLKEIRESLNKYNYKIEKVYTDGEPTEISGNIQSLIMEKLKSRSNDSITIIETLDTTNTTVTSDYTVANKDNSL